MLAKEDALTPSKASSFAQINPISDAALPQEDKDDIAKMLADYKKNVAAEKADNSYINKESTKLHSDFKTLGVE